MRKTARFEAGQFCWVDLATTDAVSAKTFYAELFGWRFEDTQAGGQPYSLCVRDGARVAALYTIGFGMRGVPPHWLSYVAVADVETTARRVVDAGGKILRAPTAVSTHARVAVVQDPSGATLGLHEAGEHLGADVTHEAAAMTWNELYTTDVDRAGRFYVETLGWSAEAVKLSGLGACTIFHGSGPNASRRGGMVTMPATTKGAPSHWLAYFGVSGVEASAVRVEALGGKVLMPATDVGSLGRCAIVEDPSGAVFGLMASAR